MSAQPARTGRITTRALAEVGIILVGVLLALAIDRWMANLDERALEAQYLERLETNLLQDSTALDEGIAQAIGGREFGLRVVDLIENQGDTFGDTEEFFGRLETLGWFMPMEPSRETWDDLVATGRLDLLREGEARQRLSAYYQALEQQARTELDFDEQLELFEVPAWTLIPPLIRLNVYPGQAVLGEHRDFGVASEADVQQVLARIRSDPSLYGALVSAIQNHQATQIFYTGSLARLSAALAAIRIGAERDTP